MNSVAVEDLAIQRFMATADRCAARLTFKVEMAAHPNLNVNTQAYVIAASSTSSRMPQMLSDDLPAGIDISSLSLGFRGQVISAIEISGRPGYFQADIMPVLGAKLGLSFVFVTPRVSRGETVYDVDILVRRPADIDIADYASPFSIRLPVTPTESIIVHGAGFSNLRTFETDASLNTCSGLEAPTTSATAPPIVLLDHVNATLSSTGGDDSSTKQGMVVGLSFAIATLLIAISLAGVLLVVKRNQRAAYNVYEPKRNSPESIQRLQAIENRDFEIIHWQNQAANIAANGYARAYSQSPPRLGRANTCPAVSSYQVGARDHGGTFQRAQSASPGLWAARSSGRHAPPYVPPDAYTNVQWDTAADFRLDDPTPETMAELNTSYDEPEYMSNAQDSWL